LSTQRTMLANMAGSMNCRGRLFQLGSTHWYRSGTPPAAAMSASGVGPESEAIPSETGSPLATLLGTDPRIQVKLVAPRARVPLHTHPDAEFALRHLGSSCGKAEAWILLEAPVPPRRSGRATSCSYGRGSRTPSAAGPSSWRFRSRQTWACWPSGAADPRAGLAGAAPPRRHVRLRGRAGPPVHRRGPASGHPGLRSPQLSHPPLRAARAGRRWPAGNGGARPSGRGRAGPPGCRPGTGTASPHGPNRARPGGGRG
jgi:hypothetical protein